MKLTLNTLKRMIKEAYRTALGPTGQEIALINEITDQAVMKLDGVISGVYRQYMRQIIRKHLVAAVNELHEEANKGNK